MPKRAYEELAYIACTNFRVNLVFWTGKKVEGKWIPDGWKKKSDPTLIAINLPDTLVWHFFACIAEHQDPTLSKKDSYEQGQKRAGRLTIQQIKGVARYLLGYKRVSKQIRNLPEIRYFREHDLKIEFGWIDRETESKLYRRAKKIRFSIVRTMVSTFIHEMAHDQHPYWRSDRRHQMIRAHEEKRMRELSLRDIELLAKAIVSCYHRYRHKRFLQRFFLPEHLLIHPKSKKRSA